MLVFAPQPVNLQKTNAESHLEKLENLLSAYDPKLSQGRNLQLAYTAEEFTRLAKEFKPEILYYYGHGKGDIQKARLCFAVGKNHEHRNVPIANLALFLRNNKIPLKIAYINCCFGDAGGFLGAGIQLGDFVPVVITNRTVAMIDTAQAQAMAFWEDVLIKGTPPHKAVSTLYSRMGELDLTTADIRWMTPVIHCHYNNWKSNPPKSPNRMAHDPFWHLKIDRVSQFSTVATQTRQMLREQKPRTLAFVWYGEQGQGIEKFNQRLNIELREDLTNTHIYEIRPEWPVEFHNPHRSFSDMLTEVFEVNDLDDIPARIRSKSHGTFGKQTLVYVRHQPVKSPKLFNPGRLKTYLEWWDHTFVSLLKQSQHFVLLGIPFSVKNPPKFLAELEKEHLDNLDLNDTVFRVLDEMEKIARRDLLDFLRTHNIRLPIKRRDQVLEHILKKTGGHYNKTVEQLKKLVEYAWSISEKDSQRTEKKADYDY